MQLLDESTDLEVVARRSSQDFLVTVTRNFRFWARLYALGIFTLPQDDVVIALPNPVSRYCVDLEISTDRLNKKAKRETRNFRVFTGENFSLALKKTALHHLETGGTWMTRLLIGNIIKMQKTEGVAVKFVAFALVDEETGEILAASLGYALGKNFHDFSAGTFVKDERSLGRSLLRLQRRALKTAGFAFWYLGFELPYMKELAGRGYARDEFFEKWKQGGEDSRCFARLTGSA